MKLVWINLVAIIIALSALVAETATVEPNFQFNEISALQKVPLFQSDALKNDTKKHSEKSVFIAEDFIPVLVIADIQNPNQEFFHYLPLYKLIRQKEYFLLI